MPAVWAALLPHPPLLVPDLAGGAAAELDPLRSACREALRSVLPASRAVLVLGDGPVWGLARPGAFGSFMPYGTELRARLPGRVLPLDLSGLPEPVALDELPLSLAVAAWLLGTLGADASEAPRRDLPGLPVAADRPGPGPGTAVLRVAEAAADRPGPGPGTAEVRVAALHLAAVTIPSTLGRGAAIAVGRELARAADPSGPVGVVAMGDLSARRSARAPGAFHPAAAGFDAAIAQAAAAGDLAALAALDPSLAGELMVAGRAVLQALAGALDGAGRLHGRVLYDDAPYGVGYVVATLTADAAAARRSDPPPMKVRAPARAEGRPGPVLAVVGPTAAGKTALALELAPRLGAEVVSADAMLVYRGMDIGTAKPTPAELARVPHHLVDVVDPSEEFSVARFQPMARAAIASILARGRVPLLVGGSGLYFHAVVDEFEFPPTDAAVRCRLEAEAADAGLPALYERLAGRDPAAAARIQPGNLRRIVRALEVIELTGMPFSSFRRAMDEPVSRYRLTVLGLDPGPERSRQRVAGRVAAMAAAGLVDEVRRLAAGPLSRTARQALGYKEVLDAIERGGSTVDALDEVVARTRAYARRQLAWFRRDPRIRWGTLPDGPGLVAWALRELAEG